MLSSSTLRPWKQYLLSVSHCDDHQFILLLYHSCTDFLLWIQPTFHTISLSTVQLRQSKAGLRKENKEEKESGTLSGWPFWAAAWIWDSLFRSWRVNRIFAGKVEKKMVSTLPWHEANSHQEIKNKMLQVKEMVNSEFLDLDSNIKANRCDLLVENTDYCVFKESYLLCNFQAVILKLMILLSLGLKTSSGKTLAWKQI